MQVVENRVRKKRSRRGLNVFQYAQTVEHDTWEDEKRRQDLQVPDIVMECTFPILTVIPGANI